ncbi:hypothetical protein E2C01_055951 [Portunus trituberculatus]|uniref:Uncharacterized protein n=1 Tax=Portunus trituberculatus TaxID=210409 RepID=A0A5B7GZ08_PORTR|nr:hypothetical protein [Portunus trituberculatus]
MAATALHLPDEHRASSPPLHLTPRHVILHELLNEFVCSDKRYFTRRSFRCLSRRGAEPTNGQRKPVTAKRTRRTSTSTCPAAVTLHAGPRCSYRGCKIVVPFQEEQQASTLSGTTSAWYPSLPPTVVAVATYSSSPRPHLRQSRHHSLSLITLPGKLL